VSSLGDFAANVGPWVLAFIGFTALIILHELGHFVAAKLTGMRVERFSLFFPPLIVRRQIGETEYAIGATPLGGYVKITGMNPEEKLPPDIAPRAYYHQPVWKRVVVILAGPAMSILTAFFIFFGLAFSADKLSTKVLATQSNKPAHGVLLPGDRILAVDGRTGKPGSLEHQLSVFRDRISSHKCPGRPRPGCTAATPAELLVERKGRTVKLRVRPVYDKAAKRTIIGVRFGESRHPDVVEAARLAGQQMWRITTATVGIFVRLFEAKERKKVSGVVGSYEVTRRTFSQDIRLAIGVLGVISLSLGIINLFPFLPLDGGHVFWSLVEKVRGRPVPYRVMEQAGVLGFMLVILLFFIGLSNDIGRLTDGGFNTR
jgi:regulator of sigma E protease